jgi:hypothetical protein
MSFFFRCCSRLEFLFFHGGEKTEGVFCFGHMVYPRSVHICVCRFMEPMESDRDCCLCGGLLSFPTGALVGIGGIGSRWEMMGMTS